MRFQESKISCPWSQSLRDTEDLGKTFFTQTAISVSERAHASSGPGIPDTLTRLTEARNPWPPCRGDPRGDARTRYPVRFKDKPEARGLEVLTLPPSCVLWEKLFNFPLCLFSFYNFPICDMRLATTPPWQSVGEACGPISSRGPVRFVTCGTMSS